MTFYLGSSEQPQALRHSIHETKLDTYGKFSSQMKDTMIKVLLL